MSTTVEEIAKEVAPASDDENTLNSAKSAQGERGGDTNSSLNQSIHSSDNIQEDSMNARTENDDQDSSRGSTKFTGDDDSVSLGGLTHEELEEYRRRRNLPEEDEKEEDGTPILTNAYLKRLCKSDWQKYYRTPHLNEKLYLHYKGFRKMKNLGQFTQLKCLYFEGNGCTSLTGLEENHQLRSLYIQENCIDKIEGLENMKELRVMNISDNMLKKIDGLEGCVIMDTLHMKANRLGQLKEEDGGDIECLKGLLACPTLSCVDIQANYLHDPAIVDEILCKLPNLKVLYTQGNSFCKKIPSYRKVVINKIKTLMYLDDRPVFEEDRRRAEAFCRGGMDEERKEIAIIKKEKSDKHWANHEAFQLMIEKARKSKKAEAKEKDDRSADEIKEDKKLSMKEMMAKAKAEKEEAAKKKDSEENPAIELTAEERKETKEYFDNIKQKYDERYFEKQAGVKHQEEPEWREGEVQKQTKQDDMMGAEEYDRKLQQQLDLANEAALKDFSHKGASQKFGCTIEEVNDDLIEDLPPSLEEVSEQQRRDEELLKTKEIKQQEWLNKVMVEAEKQKTMSDEEKKEFIEQKKQEREKE